MRRRGSPDAEHAGGGDVVGTAGRRGERVREPGEGRRPSDAEGDHRPSGADAEHDGDEQGEDQTGEGDEHVDQPGDGTTGPPAHHRREHTEGDPERRRQRRRQQRVPQRQPGGDEDTSEDVASEAVGAGRVLPGGALQHRRRVDLISGITPDERGEQGEEQQNRHTDEPDTPAGRREQRAHPLGELHRLVLLDDRARVDDGEEDVDDQVDGERDRRRAGG